MKRKRRPFIKRAHLELGFVEADSIVRAYISEYGLVVGLLIAIL